LRAMGYIRSGNIATPNLNPQFETSNERGSDIWIAHG